jgi:S-DNA-T family DNA segregation ATPase FtsK/SpoIIIE
LLPYLASARDLRLNVVVSRPVAGAARAMFDAALQGIRDTGGTALIMSGDRSEGAILPKLYAEPMIAGRGRLARRGERPTLVQVANFVGGAGAGEGTSVDAWEGAEKSAMLGDAATIGKAPSPEADIAPDAEHSTSRTLPAGPVGSGRDSGSAASVTGTAPTGGDEPPLTRRRRAHRNP